PFAMANGTADVPSLVDQTVTVITESATLTSDGVVVGRPELGDSFRIEKDEGGKLWVKSRNAYLNRSDVILYQDAIDYFTLRLKKHPSSSDFEARGRCWHKRGADSLALSDLNESIHLDRTNSNAYINRGFVWLTKREFEKALVDFSDAI